VRPLHTRTPRARSTRGKCRDFSEFGWPPYCCDEAMIWFLERNSDLVICEIRRTEDADPAYEFEVAATDAPPRTRRFNSPSELIDGYLREQAQLRAQGWRPRASDIAVLTEEKRAGLLRKKFHSAADLERKRLMLLHVAGRGTPLARFLPE
jgi:hypothetical protein